MIVIRAWLEGCRRAGSCDQQDETEFIAGLVRSGLMTAEEVNAFQVSLPPTGEPPSVQLLATELVRRRRLTKYQAGRVAAGPAAHYTKNRARH